MDHSSASAGRASIQNDPVDVAARFRLAKANTKGDRIGFWVFAVFGTLVFAFFMFVVSSIVEPLEPAAQPIALFVLGAALISLFGWFFWYLWQSLHEEQWLIATERTLERHRIRHGKVRKEVLERALLGPISFAGSYRRHEPPPHLAFSYKGISTQMFVTFSSAGWPHVEAWLNDQGFETVTSKRWTI